MGADISQDETVFIKVKGNADFIIDSDAPTFGLTG